MLCTASNHVGFPTDRAVVIGTIGIGPRVNLITSVRPDMNYWALQIHRVSPDPVRRSGEALRTGLNWLEF